MEFKEGQSVVFVHEQGGGKILEIRSSHGFLVEDEDGFERICRKGEIAPVYGSDYKLENIKVRDLNADESFSSGKRLERRGRLSGSRKAVDVWEIDLHIEALTDSHQEWTNTEIVQKQMLEFRTFYNKARGRRIRKLIVIHGIGAGVLKEEVRIFLAGQEGIEFFDADYREYGKGATAVEIRYNITNVHSS